MNLSTAIFAAFGDFNKLKDTVKKSSDSNELDDLNAQEQANDNEIDRLKKEIENLNKSINKTKDENTELQRKKRGVENENKMLKVQTNNNTTNLQNEIKLKNDELQQAQSKLEANINLEKSKKAKLKKYEDAQRKYNDKLNKHKSNNELLTRNEKNLENAISLCTRDTKNINDEIKSKESYINLYTQKIKIQKEQLEIHQRQRQPITSDLPSSTNATNGSSAPYTSIERRRDIHSDSESLEEDSKVTSAKTSKIFEDDKSWYGRREIELDDLQLTVNTCECHFSMANIYAILIALGGFTFASALTIMLPELNAFYNENSQLRATNGWRSVISKHCRDCEFPLINYYYDSYWYVKEAQRSYITDMVINFYGYTLFAAAFGFIVTAIILKNMHEKILLTIFNIILCVFFVLENFITTEFGFGYLFSRIAIGLLLGGITLITVKMLLEVSEKNHEAAIIENYFILFALGIFAGSFMPKLIYLVICPLVHTICIWFVRNKDLRYIDTRKLFHCNNCCQNIKSTLKLYFAVLVSSFSGPLAFVFAFPLLCKYYLYFYHSALPFCCSFVISTLLHTQTIRFMNFELQYAIALLFVVIGYILINFPFGITDTTHGSAAGILFGIGFGLGFFQDPWYFAINGFRDNERNFTPRTLLIMFVLSFVFAQTALFPLTMFDTIFWFYTGMAGMLALIALFFFGISAGIHIYKNC